MSPSGSFVFPLKATIAGVGHEAAAAVAVVAVVLAVADVVPPVDLVVAGLEPLHEGHVLVAVLAQLHLGRSLAPGEGFVRLGLDRGRVFGRPTTLAAVDLVPGRADRAVLEVVVEQYGLVAANAHIIADNARPAPRPGRAQRSPTCQG
ncbi:hypothetical protein [Isosphaera pallida]|uniref:hypothetical protein n=1 Tax=Isosphaera pallida TaxID=128 RepID=UPI0005C744F2|nr:hypothetical protein [Isosphaera pallida]